MAIDHSLFQLAERRSTRVVARAASNPRDESAHPPSPAPHKQPAKRPLHVDGEDVIFVTSSSSSSQEACSSHTTYQAPRSKKAKTSGGESKPSNSGSGKSTRKAASKKSQPAPAQSSIYSLDPTLPSSDSNDYPVPSTPLFPLQTAYPSWPNSKTEIQTARCMSTRYKPDNLPKCVSCTRRWAGDTCRFQGIRLLVRNEQKALIEIRFMPASSRVPSSSQIQFPVTWNVALEKRNIDRTMITVAKALLPVLTDEMTQHYKLPTLIRRQRETDVRATCDTCMTSLFTSSWMCVDCGREACKDCFETLTELTSEPQLYNSNNLPADQLKAKREAFMTRRDRHQRKNPFFLSCKSRMEHTVTSFLPVTRFDHSELETAVTEMKVVKDSNDLHSKPGLSDATPDPMITESVPVADEITVDSSMSSLDINANECNHPSGENVPKVEIPVTTFGPDGGLPEAMDSTEKPFIVSPVPTMELRTFLPDDLTESVFVEQWRNGTPIIVDGLLPKFNISWTPQYFIDNHGSENCLVIECQMESNKRVTVGEFFQDFGKYEGRQECWKLKDWPPASDFKTTFPDLFADFNRAVPVPSYARRDGSMNIASHFPSNIVGPDLGPKMYNAYASNEEPGSKGSTRLHMDMADAVNIMLYSEATPTGEAGSAVWDIFHADDTDKLRKFLRTHFKCPTDPIHGQNFYLDSQLRQRLYEEQGVKSFRFYQRPGQAVFIPAGCAHQVCNLADCIKVACDFVSPENIERCERLTREFRDQNSERQWKEDVLQLRTMMWYAWLSCRRLQKEGIAGVPVDGANEQEPEEESTSG